MPRPGILDSLSADQIDNLVGWMDDPSIKIETVLERVAAPPLQGFGVHTHATSIRRFYRRHKLRQAEEEVVLARIGHLNAEDQMLLRRSATTALTRLAFEAASGPGHAQGQLAAAMKWLSAMQEHELKRDHLELRRQQLAHEQRKLHLTAVFKQAECRRQEDVDRITSAASALKEPL